MPEWKTVRVRQELVTAAAGTLETGRYRSLSEFVSEAIRLRLDELRQDRKTTVEQAEYRVIPERLLYNSNHVWAMVTPEGNVRLGLSDYAQERLKGVSGIQTRLVGQEVKKGEPFGVVETWMFMFDLYSPVSGRIVKINKALQDKTSVAEKELDEIVWIAEIRPDDLVTLGEELRDLMSLSQYKIWMSKQGQRQIPGI